MRLRGVVKKAGEGTYATVYQAHLLDNPSSLFAIKKMKVNENFREGLSHDAIREVKFLQELSHPNIIAMYDVYSSKNQNLNLVLEYLPMGDLEELIKDTSGIRYGLADIKAWMGMLSRAIWFCHENFVLHRDIKPNNLLIAADGNIKLADFGLARSFADPYLNMTPVVITRWYRPPELLYGARQYSAVVDIWSVGMVFAELVIRKPFCGGGTDMNQLELIWKNVGFPTEQNWPNVRQLPDYEKFKPDVPLPVRGRDWFTGIFGTTGSLGVDLLMTMLTLNPRKRITAKKVLQHAWWSADPKPTRTADLPKNSKKVAGLQKVADDLAQLPGTVEDPGRVKVARKLDFSSMRR